MMDSAVYKGNIRHRRFTERSHVFNYSVFMVLLDLDEVGHVFDGCPGWTCGGRGVAQFRRQDHFGDPATSLKKCAQEKVFQATGKMPEKVQLLCNLRYFGYVINPVCFYFCYGPVGELLATLAEVTNTPWKDRHVYVMCPEGGATHSTRSESRFEKVMHVSPFMDMDQEYHCFHRKQDENLVLHLENWRGEDKLFDATLVLKREEITPSRMVALLVAYPLMTVKVIAAIHIEALKLWIKGVRVRPYPENKQKHEGVKIHE